jgi:2-iminobutanoate/2-iminopropanoate deaminase
MSKEKKEVIYTDRAATTGAPLCQATKIGNLVFCSGQSPRDPKQGNKVVEGGIREHTKQALENLKAVLEAAGSGLEYILKTTCYLIDFDESLAPFNEVWREYFGENVPARTAFGVVKLRENYLCEIEAVAYVPN